LKAQATLHSGTNIIEVDVQSAFTAIIANPAAFGFANVTSACISTTACVTGPLATQNTYLFWDGVHPTEAGHKLVAAMIAQYIYTPTLTEGVGMFADETYETRRANSADLADVLHGTQGSEGDNQYFVQAVGSTGSRNKDIAMQTTIGTTATLSAQKAYDFNLAGIRAGALHSLSSDLSFGIGVTALTGDAKAFMVSAKPTDVSVDFGLDWRPGSYFVSATLGGGLGSYSDYRRQTLIAAFYEHLNQVDSSSLSTSIQVGCDHTVGNWTVTPLARLSYVEATQESFSEQGTIAAVDFQHRKVSATSGTVEVQAEGKLTDSIALNGELGYEGVLTGLESPLKGHLINNSAQPFATDMGKIGSPGMLVGAGLTTKIGGFSVSAQYSANFGSNDQKNQSAILSFNKSF
jgi:outer membrane lipase/esterase